MSQITDHTLPPAGRAGRAINDSMPAHVAGMMIRRLNEAGKVIKGSKGKTAAPSVMGDE